MGEAIDNASLFLASISDKVAAEISPYVQGRCEVKESSLSADLVDDAPILSPDLSVDIPPSLLRDLLLHHLKIVDADTRAH